MNIEDISKVINNSTWVSIVNSGNEPINFKFSHGKDLAINGKNHLHYTLSCSDGKVVIQLETKGKYYVEYVNDFLIHFYNDNETFRITPE